MVLNGVACDCLIGSQAEDVLQMDRVILLMVFSRTVPDRLATGQSAGRTCIMDEAVKSSTLFVPRLVLLSSGEQDTGIC